MKRDKSRKRGSLKASVLLGILPLVLLALIALSLMGYNTARKTIINSIESEMTLALNNAIENIQTSLGKSAMVADTMARTVEIKGRDMTQDEYGNLLTSFVGTNDEIFGSGIWFEPYAFNENTQYFSPYCMRENGTPVYIENYSLGEGQLYIDQDWYTSAKSTSSPVVWSAPYYDSYAKVSMVTASAPFYDAAGHLMGVATTDIDLTHMQEIVNSIRIRNTGRVFLVDANGTYIADEDSEKLLKASITADKNASLSKLGTEILSKHSGKGTYIQDGETYLAWYDEVPESGWIVVSVISKSDLFSGVDTLAKKLIVTGLITAVIVCIFLLFFISRKVVSPLGKLAQVTGAIANGNLDVEMTYRSNDEIGVVCDSMRQTASRLKDYIAYIDEIAGVLKQIADGDLNFNLNQEYTGEFARLKDALLQIQKNLVNTIREIIEASERVSAGTHEISEATQMLSQGAISQSASIEEISGNIAEMQKLITDGAKNLSAARELSDKTSLAIEEDSRRMQEMSEAMEEIGTASAEISKIIKTVEDIAFQTNILALNAAVEAARAGAAGKGFSVVADEVRNLANKSSEASKNTAELIERSLQAVERGKRVVSATTEAMKQVVEDVGETAVVINGVADKSAEEVRFIDSITEAVEQVAGVVTSNSSMSEETAAKCAELFEEAKFLQQSALRFRI